MRILDKYIIKNFLVPFVYCLVLFIFLFIIIDLFGHLDEILKYKVPLLILCEYYLSMAPFIIMQTSPVAALIATIYVISTMNKYAEITAMRASGINIFRILLPFICIGLSVSVIIFAVSEKLIPLSAKNVHYIKQNYMEKERHDTDKNNAIINNIALYGRNDRLIFIRSYDIYNNTAAGITILEQGSKGNVIEKTNAEKGKWVGSTWLFSNILIYKLDEKGMVSGNPSFFEEKNLDMESPADIISKGIDYEFMSFKELSNYIRNFSNASPDITHRLQVDLHRKISFPFTSLIVILIGAGSSMKIKHRGKTAALMGVGISIIIGSLYYALMAMFIAFGKGGIFPPFLSAHLANIFFGSIGIILIRN